MKHMLGMPGGEGLGFLPSVALAASQAAQAYGLDQHKFLDNLLLILASFWPLLPVILGGLLLWDALADTSKAALTRGECFHNKYFQNKDLGCRFRCPSFDA
ncbi:MAG: hypothetical protein WBQ68_12585 [Terriglobales bacterium]